MIEKALKTLEFHKISQIIKDLCLTEMGRSIDIKPLSDFPNIEMEFQELGEMGKIMNSKGDVPLKPFSAKLKDFLEKTAVQGTVLEGAELLEIKMVLETTRSIKSFFENIGNEFPIFFNYSNNLVFLKDIYIKISRTFDAEGIISDTASRDLKRIRDRIRDLKNVIKGRLESFFEIERLQQIFQDKIITLREGRYVLALKGNFQKFISGIIHHTSNTGNTFFVEPLSIVSYNNQLAILIQEEEKEIRRILGLLSKEVGERREEILNNCEIIAKIDLARAKYLYLCKNNCIIPRINSRGGVKLLGARNPLLLLNKEAVPVDLFLDETKRVVILSGPNAGGKTVALKTLGLLSLMVMAGIPIPAAQGTEISLFSSIFADIGDEQDIQNDLSTYTARLQNFKEIADKCDERSLVLIDEIGDGTDPSEGAALAMAFLDSIGSKGAFIFVTTHSNIIKRYGKSKEGVRNASTLFDPLSLTPLYRIEYDTLGFSQSLSIAERVGIPLPIIEKAQKYLHQDLGQWYSLWKDMECERFQLKREREMVEQLKTLVQRHEKALKVLLEKFESEKEKMKLLAKKEIDSIIARAKDILALINSRKGNNIKVGAGLCARPIGRPETAAPTNLTPTVTGEDHHIVKKLYESKEKLDSSWKIERPYYEFKVGDEVKILNKVGVIQNISKEKKRAEISIGNMKFWVTIEDLDKVDGPRHKIKGEGRREKGNFSYPSSLIPLFSPSPNVPDQINIRGMTVDEAMPLVDKFLDNAILSGLSEICIIHGVGSGRLKKAVGEYLRNHSHVRTFKSAGPYEGGPSVTKIEIKE